MLIQDFVMYHFFTLNRVFLSWFPKDQYCPPLILTTIITNPNGLKLQYSKRCIFLKLNYFICLNSHAFFWHFPLSMDQSWASAEQTNLCDNLQLLYEIFQAFDGFQWSTISLGLYSFEKAAIRFCIIQVWQIAILNHVEYLILFCFSFCCC